MALKMTMSLLAEKKKRFVLLPKEQRLTEETLIKLEHRIAKTVHQNENMLSQSEKRAARCSLTL